MERELIVSLIVLSMLGLINSGRIAVRNFKKKPLVCPIGGHDCNTVVESRWNRIFFIKNEYLGFLFYFTTLVGALSLFFSQALLQFMLYAGALAFLFSLLLVYIQARIIKTYCFYCMLSALITTLLFVNELLLVI